MADLFQKLFVGHNNSPFFTVIDGADDSTASPTNPPASHGKRVALSPDDAVVCVCATQANAFMLYAAPTLAEISVTGKPSGTSGGNGCAFLPDGSQLVVVHGGSGAKVSVYDTSTWNVVSNTPSDQPASAALAVSVSPAGDLVAVGENSWPRLVLYDVPGWTRRANIASLPPGAVRALAFSPDGSVLAVSTSASPYLLLYNTSTWDLISSPAYMPYAQHPDELGFSPDGSMLAVAGYVGAGGAGYVVYNVADWTPVNNLPDHPEAWCHALCWLSNKNLALGATVTAFPADRRLTVVDVDVGAWVADYDAVLGQIPNGIAAIRVDEPDPGPAPGVDIDTPVEITVTSAAQTIDTPVRVQVGTAGNIDTATRITVVAASVLAGLNGAGGWPAAPDGKWRAVVHLAGVDISALLIDVVRVSMADDEASTAQFSFRPGAALAPMDLIRRQVRITFAPASGLNAQLMFTGVVDVPEIDVRTGVIECRCTDQLQEIIANTPRGWIDANVGGRWSEAVSGIPVDTWDYLEARIKSVPKSIALDRLQRPVVLPWRDLPRSVTIKAADHVHGTVSVELPSSAQIRTRVTARLQYRYTRLRARGAVAAWAQPFEFFAAYDNVTGLRLRQWLLASMIESAAERMPAWDRVGQVRIEHPEAGVYFPNPPNFLGYSIGVEVAPTLASRFTARYRTRWTQTVTESYAITLRLADLEAAIGGPVSEEFGANLVAGPAPERWPSDYTTLPDVVAPSVGDAMQAWYTDGADEAARDEALRTLHDQAWVRLWSASRSGRVSLTLPCRPDLWLDVWATVERDGVHAAGKVTALTHAMNAQSGEAITSLSIAVGMPGNAPAAMPAPTLPGVPAEDTDRPLSAYSVEIGTYVGGESGSPAFDPETMIGYITNTRLRGVVGEELYHRYPHQLSMRAPSIDEIDRDPLTLDASITIDTEIPTDLLETS